MENYAVVYLPKIDLNKINVLREKYDPQYGVIDPHITLVFPFSNIPEEKILFHLKEVTQNIKPFKISMNGLMKSFDNYLFLLVGNGKEDIENVHDKLYFGVLAPQLSTGIPFTPHITLGLFQSKNGQFNEVSYETAKKEAEEMEMDFIAPFNSISLIKGNGIVPAKIVKTFNLRY